MDYNIKIKTDGIGKAATEARKKVLQAQKLSSKKIETPKSAIDINKRLIDSIQKAQKKSKEDQIKLIKEIQSKYEIQKEKTTPRLKEPIEKIKGKRTPQLKESVKKIKAIDLPKPEKLIENKKLITSLDDLTKTNKDLNKTTKDDIKKRGITPRATGAGATAAGVAGRAAGGAGIGGIGASIPIVGAGIAALGFTIQKINQIGNAYIELSSQQLRTVGMGGFRRGQGIYGATEMGAGMAAFARGTGRFAENVETTEGQIKVPLAIGTRYGMSAEQILGQAGLFRRAGGRIEETAAIAAGGGVQADMPTLLTGMAGVLEEAIRNGVDTTDMAKDLGTGLTRLAMETPARSAEAALSIVRSFQGVKQGVSRGQLAGFENMYVAQAGRSILMEKLQNPDYLKRLTESGWISERQKRKIEEMGPGVSYQQLQRGIGISAAQSLTQKTVNETKDTEMLVRTIQQVQKTWGKGAEARQQFQTVAQSMGWSLSPEQLVPVWNLASKDLPKSEYVKQMKEIGAKKITKGAEKVETGPVGMGMQKLIQQQNLMLDYGKSFADSSLKMQTAMIDFTKKAMPAVTTAMDGFGSGLSTLIGGIGDFVKTLKKIKEEGIWSVL